MRIGARRSPCSWSKRSPGDGIDFRKLSERGLYAFVEGEERSRYVRIEREDGSENSILHMRSKTLERANCNRRLRTGEYTAMSCHVHNASEEAGMSRCLVPPFQRRFY